MLPGPTGDDVRDRPLSGVESPGQGVLGFPRLVAGPDLQDVRLGEATVRNPLSLPHPRHGAVTGSTLSRPVVGVVSPGTQEEMVRTSTWRIVAPMQDAHRIIGDLSEMEHPRDLVRLETPGLTVAVEGELPVPVAQPACENPAVTQLGAVLGDGTVTVDLRPEPIKLIRGKIEEHGVPPVRCVWGRGAYDTAVPSF